MSADAKFPLPPELHRRIEQMAGRFERGVVMSPTDLRDYLALLAQLAFQLGCQHQMNEDFSGFKAILAVEKARTA